MRILSKFKESTLRTAFITFAVFSLAVFSIVFVNIVFTNSFTIDDCLWLDKTDEGDTVSKVIITEIVPGGVADTAGFLDGDQLLAINGETFKTSFGAQRILNKYSNEVIEYTIIRDGVRMNLDIAVYNFVNLQFLILSILGISFMVIGLIVGYANPKGVTPFQFFILSCSAPFGLSLFSSNLNLNLNAQFEFINIVYIVYALLFYSIFVHFFLNFPEQYKFRYRKIFVVLLYLLGIGQFFIIDKFGIIVLSLFIITGFIFFFVSYMKIKEPENRKPLSAIIIGLVVGFIGLIYFAVLAFISKRPVFLINPLLIFPTVLSFAIPISFGYSIIRYKILDTERVVKRSIAFGIITLFIICIYLIIALALNAVFMRYFENAAQLSTIISIIIITFSYDFINKKIKVFVDKQFYKERYNYRQSLLEFAEQLPYFKNVNEVLVKLANSIKDTIGIKNVDIWITDTVYLDLINPNQERFKKIESEDPTGYNENLLSLFKNNSEPIVISDTFLRENKFHDKLLEEFVTQKTVVLVPMNIRDNIIGIMKFGKKPSGKAYSEEDIDLLKTLTSQVAISFENKRLQQEELNRSRIEEEILIAKNIQNSLLPEWTSKNPIVDISYYSKPARDIGGDFYDFIEVDDDKFYVVIADVSGKGIPAALYMAKVQSMIQLASNLFHSPREILIEVNKNIKNQLDKASFVTCIIALVDLKANKVKIARAGHNPVAYSSNGSIEFLQTKGIGLNLTSDELFRENLEEAELPLKSSDLFVFYSDGLSEAMNLSRDEYGEKNLINLIKNFRENNSEEIKTAMINSVNEFTSGAEQHDDITMVILKINNNDRKILP